MRDDDRQPELVRAVGLASLTAIALNGVIGAGVFVLPATVARILGPASPVAYVVAAVVAGLVALCFAEAGSRCDRTGGPYVYAREAFGSFVGFEAGWMFLVSRVTAVAAIANAFCSYLGFFWPRLGTGPGRALAMTAALGGLAAINVLGVRRGATMVNVLTIGKLGPLLLFAVAGLLHASAGSYTFHPPAWAPLKQASLVLIFAFGGFESASVPSDEMVDARRNLPAALLTAVGATAALYIAIQIAALGALPLDELASSGTPLASAARVFLGPGGGTLLTLGAVLSTMGATSANVLAAPRVLYALARARLVPEVLGRVHPRHRTPHVAVMVFAAVSWALAVTGTFAQLAALSAVSRLFFNATTCLAVPVLRRLVPVRGPVFRLPGGPVIPGLAVACAAWLLTGSSRRELLGGAVALIVGATLYLLGRRGSRPEVVAPSPGGVV